MSPLPGPVPHRRRVLSLMCSPAGLLLGFVVLLIATCPGARGNPDGGLYAVVMSDGLPVIANDALSGLNVAVPPTRPRATVRRPTTIDRGIMTTVRPITADDRDPQPTTGTFLRSKAVLPLLIDPMLDDAPRVRPASIVPMTGPSVGVKSRVGGSTR